MDSGPAPQVGNCRPKAHPGMTASSVEQARRVIDHRTFDGEHFEFGHNPAIGGESAGLAAGGQHAVAGHHNRTGIAPERLADIARQLDAAEPLGDIAIGHRLARRDGARDLIDPAVEFGNAVEIEHDVGEIVRLAREQLDDPVDRALYFGGGRRLRDAAVALADAGTGLVFIGHRQLHRIDAARTPDLAAAADRGVEYCKMLVGHGWLQTLSPHVLSLMLAWNLGLEIVAIHPNSGRNPVPSHEKERRRPEICRHRFVAEKKIACSGMCPGSAPNSRRYSCTSASTTSSGSTPPRART